MRPKEIVDTIDEVLKHISDTYCKKNLSEKGRKIREDRCKELKQNIAKITELKKEEQSVLPSFEKFLNTMKTLIESYSTMPGDKKLQIAEVLVLNTFVKDGKVHRIELNEPFNELINYSNTIWFGM